jgi:Holliday junction resolvase-like predicted endonuclease
VTDPRAALGARGELLAAVVYVLCGHRILGRRVLTPPAEVDLVCRRGHDLVLVEVKRRRSAPQGVPWIADDQVERLYAAAEWLRRRHRWARRVRVELVTIEGWRPCRRGTL